MVSAVDAQIRVLHVDDDTAFLDLTSAFLERNDDRFSTETATSAEEALSALADSPPDCIVSDYDMPHTDGIELLRAVREQYPELPFILFTGEGSERVASDAVDAGVTNYLQKRSGSEQYKLLANRIRNAVRARRDAERAARQEELMRLTELAGDTGGWELDLETEMLTLTEGARRLVGLAADDELSLEEAVEMYHPDDRAAVREAIDRAIERGEKTGGTFRLQPSDAETRLLDVTLTPVTTNGSTTALRGAISDVTDSHRRRQDLESERRFVQQALDTLDDVFFVLDVDGTLERWNEKAAAITGHTDAELDGMDVLRLFPADEREAVSDAIDAVLADGEAAGRADLLDADGSRIPYEFVGTRLTDPDGNTTGLVGTGRDLTERRRQERRFRALVEESNDIVSIVDAEGRYEYESPSVERILGHDSEEKIGESAWEYVHPDDIDHVREMIASWANEPESTHVMEYRARHADGTWRWLETRTSDHQDNPAVDGYVLNSRDITERKRHQQELEKINAQYQTLVENFPDGAVFLFDDDFRYVRAGGEELARVGLSAETVEGATPQDLLGDELAEETVAHYRKTLSGSAQTFEHEYQGECYHVQTAPVGCGDGDITHGIAVSQNVTEAVEQREKLERQNEQLEEFASIVSHDLRNPLDVAAGRIELAQESTEKEHLARAAEAIDRSQTLIEDLLTLARQDRRSVDPAPVRVATLADESWQTVDTAEATLETDIEATIRADSGRLQQLLENLYRNAVEHGGADVTVRVGELDDGFYVADDGPGIPDAYRDEIFQVGYSTSPDGTGFGLRIVEQVVDAHGWEISVAESWAGGARFDITGVHNVTVAQ
jgi:PAS domain S-box-containing protein